MTEERKRDEFNEIEEMIRMILERTLRGQGGSLPPGFRIIITGGEITAGKGQTPSPLSRKAEEPQYEVFEEEEGVKILVEVPGATSATTHLQITGTMLRIYADGGGRRYRTSVDLPPVQKESMTSRMIHGILEITFSRIPPEL
jgi:HSP20 family protein